MDGFGPITGYAPGTLSRSLTGRGAPYTITLAFLVSASPTFAFGYVFGFAFTAFSTPAYGAFPSTLDGYALALSALTSASGAGFRSRPRSRRGAGF